MRLALLITILLILKNPIFAIENSADLFTYDENQVEQEFAELKKIESFLIQNPEISDTEIIKQFPQIGNMLNSAMYLPLNAMEIVSPGKIPSFWFAFTLSAIGTYFIYGAVAGPVSVGIVYFSSEKDKIETKKAIWGCLTGTLVGAGIKYAVVSLL